MAANGAAPRYELKECLGEGGMGVVYRAYDHRTNSDVALKTLKDAADPVVLEMFKREWAELGKIPHPNIVDIRDVDEIEEKGVRKPCFIMPLLPGCTLAQLIKASSPRLTVDFVVNVVSQVCKGLQAAHEKDLVHRDIKPSNIFIMDDDTAKIIDFGLVHSVGNKSTTGLKGTWQYMAPEQIDGSRHPNRSFDIYSLGVVAYEALTGHQPFKRGEFRDTVDAIRHFIPQAISERNPKVPQLVSKAVHVAMAKQPIHRYSTAREFGETLQKAYHNQYIERFDPVKIRPRIDRAKRAFTGGDPDFASEILTELEAEGNLDPEITLLRSQIDESNRHKRVRLLFEAAQTRVEQDEVPLALDKLEEILKIDPQNQEALKMRKRVEDQRNKHQVSGWLELARKHLANHDFGEARHALKEVFNLKYDDPDAARLKAQVEARDKEVQTARADKENLYNSALRHNQNGEISSALSHLEQLLELARNVPGASVPERDKVFQAFYNDVRTERDRMDNTYAEASRHLADKNFAKATESCDSILSRYPQNAQFQALRLKIVNSQRQQLSAYIAEVTHAVETEPNLDRRVGLLEQACKSYPSEEQFSRQLSLQRDLRDLVGSIVARSKHYEEQGQFTEAIAQWNTLVNIHPQYPGIDFEISQLERRREKQAAEDKKSKAVSKIDRALAEGAYADAEHLSQDALVEFPQNPELLVLLEHARQGLERNRQADRLFEEAKLQRSFGDWDRAIALLHQALDLDKGNIVIQNTLVNLLVERSHALLDTDAAAAEPLAAEASHLDPDHPSVKKVLALIAQAKRKQDIERTVLEARALQNTDRNQAIQILKGGLTVYPNESRLQQTLATLQEERAFHATMLGGAEKTVVNPLAQPERVAAAPPPPAPPAPPPAKPPAKPVAPPPPPSLESTHHGKAQGPSVLKQVKETGELFVENIKTRLGGESRNLIGVLLGLGASAILLSFLYWFFNRPPAAITPLKKDATVTSTSPIAAPKKPEPATQPSAGASVQVVLQVTPPDASVSIDGQPISTNTLSLKPDTTHSITVSHAGYQTIENPSLKVTGKPWVFALAPQPLNISVSVSEPKGSVWLDDQRVGDLDEGSWSHSYSIKTSEEQHILEAKNRNGASLFKLSYSIEAGKIAAVSPLQTKDLTVVSSLGTDAWIYSANPGAKLLLPGRIRKFIPPAGLSVNLGASEDSIQIADGKHTDSLAVRAGQAPALTVSLNAAPNLVPILITATPKNAKLYIDNDPVRPKRPGYWFWNVVPGAYTGKITADGMADQTFPINAKRGGSFKQKFDLKPNAPVQSILVISGGTPEAAVSLEGTQIGALDEQGNGRFPVSPGTHNITLSKTGFGDWSYSGARLIAGKETSIPSVQKLSPVAGYLKFMSVVPPNASVSLNLVGQSKKTAVTDFTKILNLPPGSYELTADAPKYVPQVREIKVGPNQTVPLTIELTPMKPADESKETFVNQQDVTKKNGDWLHGKNNNEYLRLETSFQKNTLFFSKDFRQRKFSWMVVLDHENRVTYNMDGQRLTIIREVNGKKLPTRSGEIDLSSTNNPAHSYAVVIQTDKTGFRASKQDGAPIDQTEDPAHDWSHAQLYVKGEAYFTLWTGR